MEASDRHIRYVENGTEFEILRMTKKFLMLAKISMIAIGVMLITGITNAQTEQNRQQTEQQRQKEMQQIMQQRQKEMQQKQRDEQQKQREEQRRPTAQRHQLSEGNIFPKISFRTVDGELLETEDLNGKVVFYNFYFATCAPCIAQKEGLNALYDKFHADSVVFISVTFDNHKTIKQFRDKHNIRFKIVSFPEEINRFAASYPTNILVGIDGKIVARKVGATNINAEIEKEALFTIFAPAILGELAKLKSSK